MVLDKEIKGDDVDMRVANCYTNEKTTYLPDGSLYYGSDYANATPDVVDKRVPKWNHSSYNNYTELTQERKDKFEKLINAIQGNATVLFYCAPLHPAYMPVFNLKCPGGVQAVAYVDKLADEYNIPIIGSFYPNNCGASRADFYDAVHVRKDAVNVLFDKFQHSKNK